MTAFLDGKAAMFVPESLQSRHGPSPAALLLLSQRVIHSSRGESEASPEKYFCNSLSYVLIHSFVHPKVSYPSFKKYFCEFSQLSAHSFISFIIHPEASNPSFLKNFVNLRFKCSFEIQ